MDGYAEIPAGVRDLLLGRVIHWVRTEAAIWTKREFVCLRCFSPGVSELRAETSP
ncbi:hypothetical protein BC826DRAFT_1072498 [Russula brevipes]|nr:hypothetical protein BC826DRAFT_1072498 [Russula brevipes]